MKVLFFLRHYNDIDHITPVIFKWIESGHQCDVVLIGAMKFRKDFRIEFLRSLSEVRVAHVCEIFSPLEYIRWRLQMLLLSSSFQRFFLAPLINKITEKYPAEKRELFWRHSAEKMLNRSFDGVDGGVIAFDWVERSSVINIEWIEITITMARDRGLRAVSLPHGDSPHVNQLIRSGEWRLGADAVFSNAKIFDTLVVPNELCAIRFRPFLDDKAIEVLGSPRYCEEWLLKLAEILPPSPLVRVDGQLNIAIFLRKANLTTFWEEAREMIHLVAAFPGVQLIIKAHTRGSWKQSLTKNQSIRKLTNVNVAGDKTHSAYLLDWADVIIDLATSVAFEAVRVGKPVLAADYLHAGRSTVADYMPETELRCRDDVYEKIAKLLSDGCDSFYVEANRQRFLQKMLDVPDSDVLGRYVALLENLCEQKNRFKEPLI